MNEEDVFGMWYWHEELEEDDQRKRNCPRCGSKRTHYDEDCEVWVCLDCEYEWENEGF